MILWIPNDWGGFFDVSGTSTTSKESLPRVKFVYSHKQTHEHAKIFILMWMHGYTLPTCMFQGFHHSFFYFFRYLAAVKRAAAALKSKVSRVSLLLAMRISLVTLPSPRRLRWAVFIRACIGPRKSSPHRPEPSLARHINCNYEPEPDLN